MAVIESLTDCPLLDDVNFFNDEEEVIKDTEKKPDYTGDYNLKSPSELGLIYIATRNEQDFTKLYNALKKRLYKNIINIVGTNRDDIETVVDTTMLYVYFNIEKFDVNKSNFSTWVYYIAKSMALNYINRSGFKNNNVCSIDFSELYDSSVMIDDDYIPEDNISPSYVAKDDSFIDIVYDKGKYKVYTLEDVLADFFGVIHNCIDNMPDIKKEAFRERLINNKTVKDTANKIGVSNTSVKRYYSDGKNAVINCIKNDHPELFDMMKELY